tara:strand:- start:3387 stop:4082 length:696 start_codon:yes stop_codon:yes gene_type:complete
MTPRLNICKKNFYKKFIFFIILSACTEHTPQDQKQVAPYQKSTDNLFKILILGDSLTEGYGVSETECYPFLLENKLNDNLTEKTGKSFKVINGGISGSTTSGGVSRINWFLKSNPDFLILALGGNDGLRGVPIDEIEKNLGKILSSAKKNKIPALLTGMKIPPNYGPSYTKSFSNIYKSIAEQYKIPLIPFLLEGVGGNPKMNLPDKIHPNRDGHKLICETVYESLEGILK